MSHHTDLAHCLDARKGMCMLDGSEVAGCTGEYNNTCCNVADLLHVLEEDMPHACIMHYITGQDLQDIM